MMARRATIWRWFPRALILSMLAVLAVNIWFVVLAVDSFPGTAGTDGFDLSNGYDRVLATVARQDALGWRVVADVGAGQHPVLHLARRGGPLDGAVIEARAERPVGPSEATGLSFQSALPGEYQAAEVLATGQWDVLLTVRADGQTFTATQRIRAP